jgi:hypothetical protein
MSLNRLLPDQPQPETASSTVLLGGAILAQGTVVRPFEDSVSIGNHSTVRENSAVIGTREHPVRIGQRTVFGHRAQVIGATVGDLCETESIVRAGPCVQQRNTVDVIHRTDRWPDRPHPLERP